MSVPLTPGTGAPYSALLDPRTMQNPSGPRCESREEGVEKFSTHFQPQTWQGYLAGVHGKHQQCSSEEKIPLLKTQTKTGFCCLEGQKSTKWCCTVNGGPPQSGEV